jgi:hypothetical protein
MSLLSEHGNTQKVVEIVMSEVKKSARIGGRISGTQEAMNKLILITRTTV